MGVNSARAAAALVERAGSVDTTGDNSNRKYSVSPAFFVYGSTAVATARVLHPYIGRSCTQNEFMERSATEFDGSAFNAYCRVHLQIGLTAYAYLPRRIATSAKPGNC